MERAELTRSLLGGDKGVIGAPSNPEQFTMVSQQQCFRPAHFYFIRKVFPESFFGIFPKGLRPDALNCPSVRHQLPRNSPLLSQAVLRHLAGSCPPTPFRALSPLQHIPCSYPFLKNKKKPRMTGRTSGKEGWPRAHAHSMGMPRTALLLFLLLFGAARAALDGPGPAPAPFASSGGSAGACLRKAGHAPQQGGMDG